MKNLSVLLLFFLIIVSSGCKKKSFDPSAMTREDFIGTWTGTLTTFKNNKLLTETGDFMIFPEEGNASLGGIIYLSETRVFKEFQFQSGTLYFRIYNTDPTNPACRNWDLGGYASFRDENTVDIRISGDECGYVGSEYVDWSGSLTKKPSGQDSLYYFSFAKSGYTWDYRVEANNGDTCQLQKLLAVKTGNYTFTGENTHSCTWPNFNISLKWIVTPAAFTISFDDPLTSHPVTFPVYAKKGAVYYTILNTDTIAVALQNTNQVVVTPEGSFYCNEFMFTEPVADTTGKIYKRITHLWIHERHGIIRQFVVNPVRPTNLKSMTLFSKNF